MKSINISGIILAAGDGLRFGEKKQFINFHGKEIWRYVFDTAMDLLDEIVVVGVDFNGGKTRQESVRIGLDSIHGDKVIIFDAARPFVTGEQIKKIITEVIIYPSVSYAIRQTDTIYHNGVWARNELRALQVPQAFDAKLLRHAHQHAARFGATDDTILIFNTYGIKPKLLEGGQNLYKLTYPEDIKILEAIYKTGGQKNESSNHWWARRHRSGNRG